MLHSSRTAHVSTSFSMIAVGVSLALGLAGVGQAEDPPHVVFVTSVSGTGDLGSWPEAAPGTVGVDAADSICQNLALAAGLDNPLDFVAWLSDSDDDAYCRVHGVTGKKSTNCGGAMLLPAGPWVRTDGHPFAPAIDLILNPNSEVYVPLKYDESGQVVAGSLLHRHLRRPARRRLRSVRTAGLKPTGPRARGPAKLVRPTRRAGTGPMRTSARAPPAQRLLCMEKGSGGPLPRFAQPGRLVFVTSASGTGELGAWPEADPGTSGIAAGDSICRNLR